MSNAASIDDDEVCAFAGVVGLLKSQALEQLSDLLAFVLVYFAAQCINGESFHNDSIIYTY